MVRLPALQPGFVVDASNGVVELNGGSSEWPDSDPMWRDNSMQPGGVRVALRRAMRRSRINYIAAMKADEFA